MIRVTLTSNDLMEGPAHYVSKLRKAGIPVRIGEDGEPRLLPVWNPEGTKIIGKGEMRWFKDNFTQVIEVEYAPPVVQGDYIDVEARVVPDQLLLPGR